MLIGNMCLATWNFNVLVVVLCWISSPLTQTLHPVLADAPKPQKRLEFPLGSDTPQGRRPCGLMHSEEGSSGRPKRTEMKACTDFKQPWLGGLTRDTGGDGTRDYLGSPFPSFISLYRHAPPLPMLQQRKPITQGRCLRAPLMTDPSWDRAGSGEASLLPSGSSTSLNQVKARLCGRGIQEEGERRTVFMKPKDSKVKMKFISFFGGFFFF